MSLQQCCRCPLPLTLSSAVRSEGRQGPFLFLARTVNCHTPACRSVSWTTNGSAGVPSATPATNRSCWSYMMVLLRSPPTKESIV